MNRLSKDDLISEAQSLITVQSYDKKTIIDGLQIKEIRQFSAEDGTFTEVLRLADNGTLELFPDFQLKQVNRSKLLPNAIKAWHLHYNQEDIWYVSPDDHMILGLWDLRTTSPTKGMTMKIPLGGGASRLVYIPRGVAHGVANIAPREGTIYYYVNQQFDAENPDENRLPWNACGDEFWVPERA